MKGIAVLGVLAGLVMTSAAQATISFGVTGLAGTGVTADVGFTYTAADSTSGTITIYLENTADLGRISAFAFNVPSVSGATISSIGGATDGGGVLELNPALATADPEGAVTHESGWYELFKTDEIKTPNAAGDFDFGVMNNNNESAFITDGAGSGPRILNDSDDADSTTFTFAISGTGLDLITEADWMNTLSTGVIPGYNFGVRFQGIGELSDLATTTTTEVPLPSAVLLGVMGLGTFGLVRRRR